MDVVGMGDSAAKWATSVELRKERQKYFLHSNDPQILKTQIVRFLHMAEWNLNHKNYF